MRLEVHPNSRCADLSVRRAPSCGYVSQKPSFRRFLDRDALVRDIAIAYRLEPQRCGTVVPSQANPTITATSEQTGVVALGASKHSLRQLRHEVSPPSSPQAT